MSTVPESASETGAARATFIKENIESDRVWGYNIITCLSGSNSVVE